MAFYKSFFDWEDFIRAVSGNILEDIISINKKERAIFQGGKSQNIFKLSSKNKEEKKKGS